MTYAKLRALSKQCGTYHIAKHLKNEGYPLWLTLWILTRSK